MKSERRVGSRLVPLAILILGLALGFVVTMVTEADAPTPAPVVAVAFVALMAAFFIALNKPGLGHRFLQGCASFAVGSIVEAIVNSH